MKSYWLTCSQHSPTQQVLYKILFLESLTVTLAIFGAVIFGHSPELHFKEEGFITYVSCLQLLIATVISGKIFKIIRPSQNAFLAKNALFWLVISLGLFFVTLDDALEIHEHMDLWFHSLFNVQQTAITDLADDIIVGGYLILFWAYIFTQWQTIKLFQSSFAFFKIGFVLTAIMLLLDIASNNNYFTSLIIDNTTHAKILEQWLAALEDSAKIFAEGMLIMGLYQCRKIAISMSKKY
jgi:hypothetical protein